MALPSILIELGLFGADLGIWGQPGWRRTAYAYGAFWPGLLSNWASNYPGQDTLMLFTYGVLHTGPSHMLFNMISLFSLGLMLLDRIGARRVLPIYLLSQLGGAAGFALLGQPTTPMVGASGALFGLAGALVMDQWYRTRALRPLLMACLGLIALNVLMYLTMGGRLAWQTHLGGCLAGGVSYLLLTVLRKLCRRLGTGNRAPLDPDL